MKYTYDDLHFELNNSTSFFSVNFLVDVEIV